MQANVKRITDKHGESWWLNFVDGVVIRDSDAKTLDYEDWREEYSPF